MGKPDRSCLWPVTGAGAGTVEDTCRLPMPFPNHYTKSSMEEEQFHGMGVYGVEWSGITCGGSGNNECRVILSDFGAWSGGKLQKLGNRFQRGQQDNDPKHTSKKAD